MLTCTTTPGQSAPACSGIEGVLHIPQNLRRGASASDVLVSGHALEVEFYPSAEILSVYSITPANIADFFA